jgi:predicted MFS family arabinose efflux permease
VGWGLLAPQQHRLVAVAPQSAPVVLGLNTSCTYLGVTGAGVIGALGIHAFGAHELGFIGAAFALLSIGVAELAARRIHAADSSSTGASLASV